MTGAVTVDTAGAQMGGAARFAAELKRYLDRTGRADVQVIGAGRRLCPAWLLYREVATLRRGRRIALNNVSFIAPGGERWTLIANALHFLSDNEAASLEPSLRVAMRRQAAVVRLAALRSDVLIVPCTTMANRVTRILPSVCNRIAVRPHPVSADSVPPLEREKAILCPVLFAPYKRINERLAELVGALDDEKSVKVRVTARSADLPSPLSSDKRIECVGQVNYNDLRRLWGLSHAIYFPTNLESFGYPLAEARVSGQPIIALDTAQNREIAGEALCGFIPGDRDSLRDAIALAFIKEVTPDPSPFEPDAYFDWLLG